MWIENGVKWMACGKLSLSTKRHGILSSSHEAKMCGNYSFAVFSGQKKI